MDKEVQKILLITAIIAGFGGIVYFMFYDNSEKKLYNKYYKYFEPSYFIKSIKKLYPKLFKKGIDMGYTENQVLTVLAKNYFKDNDLRDKVKLIINTKGTFIDDENKALEIINSIKSKGELSYFAYIFYNAKLLDNEVTFLDYINPVGGLIKSLKSQTAKQNLLDYMISYFNKKHRKKLIEIIKRKPKGLPYKPLKKIVVW